MKNDDSSKQQQDAKLQSEQQTKVQKTKSFRPWVWAVMGGAIGAALATGTTLGVLAANGVFDNHDDSIDYNSEHFDDEYSDDGYYDEDGQHHVVIKKPLIYLYPESETAVTVKLGAPEKLTSSYPKYTDGWNVIASPNGDLVDTDTGEKLYALYWEGQRDTSDYSFDTGFMVRGEDSAEFLKEKLEILGLNYKEKEEFMIYWLPKLEANKYNYIYFATAEEIERNMPLELSVQPDTLIRINMMFEGLDEYVDVEEQELEPAQERNGFTVVEWGGAEI